MKRIVIIEDEQVLRENIKEILTLKGFTAYAAASGDEGLDLVRTVLPDLVLCDIKMPRYDGFWVLEQIRKSNELNKIPFIFVTAKVENRDIRDGMGLGADDYITKPFSSDELIRAINARLERIGMLSSDSKEESFTYNEKDHEQVKQTLTQLTRSEIRILKMIAAGLSSSEIAERLFNSVKTVENHRSNIISKLALKGHLSLVKYCMAMKPYLEEELK